MGNMKWFFNFVEMMIFSDLYKTHFAGRVELWNDCAHYAVNEVGYRIPNSKAWEYNEFREKYDLKDMDADMFISKLKEFSKKFNVKIEKHIFEEIREINDDEAYKTMGKP